MADVTVWKTYEAQVKDANPETGEVDIFIPLSANTVDRDGEIVLPSALKKRIKTFAARPVLVSSHEYRGLLNQIGEFTNIKIGNDGFYGKPRYYINKGNAEADWGFFLASIGMASYSIGFIDYDHQTPKDGDGETKARRVYTDIELLEVSHVIIPSNRDAAQSMRNALAAKSMTPPEYLKALDGVVTKPETTENTIRVPVADSDKHKGHRMATIDISKDKGITALYCGECKTILTYIFAKDKGWDMEKAKKWVADHKDSKGFLNRDGNAFVFADKTTQGEIKDELDYLLSITKDVTLNEENRNLAKSLIPELSRLTGSDIPVDIKASIRNALTPVLKNMADHHMAHEANYKLCKDALEEICHSDSLPDGKVPSDEDKAQTAAAIAAGVREAFSHAND